MAGKRIVIPNYMPALDLNGNPLAGAKITFYENETTTLASVYANEALTTPLSNPVVADLAGVFPSIFADEDLVFTVAITDASDNPIGGLRNKDEVRPSQIFGADSAAAENAAAAAEAFLADALAIQATGDDAAAIATRAAKSANLSDLANAATARANIGADLAANVNFTPAGTGGVARPVQTSLRERPVSVLDYYDPADGANYGPALGRALNAAASIFWPNDGVARSVTSLVNVNVTTSKVIDWNGAAVTFSGSGRLNLKAPFVVSSGRTLAANATRFATSITLNSGASIQAGDILNIQSSVLPSTSISDNKQDTVRVRSVAGAVVTLEDGLNFAWSTAETGLQVVVLRPAGSATHINPNITLDETDGTGVARIAVYHEGIDGWAIQGGSIKGPLPFDREANIYRQGFVFYYSLNGLRQNNHAEAMSYPVLVAGGSRYVKEEGTTGRYNHHSNVDMGGWSSDYQLRALDDQDSFVALATHACFRADASRANVRNNTAITAWRPCGGSITDSYLHSTDSTSNTVSIQSYVPAVGYEYIYTDRGDFTLARTKFDNPNRSAADVDVHYGAKVLIDSVEAIDIKVRADVVSPVIRRNCKLSNAKTAPLRGNILALAEVPADDVLDAYLDGGVYHIDLYRSVATQSRRTLRARGQIGRRLSSGAKSVRLHYNGFTGGGSSNAPQFMVGRLIVRGIVQHTSAGFFSYIEQHYPIGMFTGGGAFVEIDTTPELTVGPKGGSTAGANVTLALSSPAITTGTDGYVSFTLTIGVDAAVSGEQYQLMYDIELTDTATV